MAGGGGGRGGGGGGRRSDVALKHDIVLLGHLDNGLGFYRFSYVGSDKAYVGVMAQEVQTVVPEAVVRGRDGYLRVFYEQARRWSSRPTTAGSHPARGSRPPPDPALKVCCSRLSETTEHQLSMRSRMS